MLCASFVFMGSMRRMGTNGIDGEDKADRADRTDRTIKTIKKKINLLLGWCSSGADMKKARMGSTWCTSHSGF